MSRIKVTEETFPTWFLPSGEKVLSLTNSDYAGGMEIAFHKTTWRENEIEEIMQCLKLAKIACMEAEKKRGECIKTDEQELEREFDTEISL